MTTPLSPATILGRSRPGGDTLTIVWHEGTYYIWDVYKCQLLRKAYSSTLFNPQDLKISGDGSKIFALYSGRIEVMSMETGERAGRVGCGYGPQGSLFVYGSKVGISTDRSRGCDFGGLEVPNFRQLSDRLRLDLVDHHTPFLAIPRWIEDTVTGSQVFQLPDKYFVQGMQFSWDGRYLLVWSRSGDLVIIDFDYVSP